MSGLRGIDPMRRFTTSLNRGMLEVTNVSKSYGTGAAQVDALIDIDLSIQPGELVAIMPRH